MSANFHDRKIADGKIVSFIFLSAIFLSPSLHAAEDLGEMWGTAAEEAKYYPITNIPIPPTVPMRPGGLEILPDGRLAVGTRRGDIYFVKGAFDSPPQPEFHLFATAPQNLSTILIISHVDYQRG